ncbi:MAG: ATP-binding protein [Ferruginibacter sp.]
MKIITTRIWRILLFFIFCFSSFAGMAQDLTEKAYRGELLRWNQFQFDSLWQFNPAKDTDIAKLPVSYEGWQTVNTEFLPDANGQPANWKGVGWFRKKFDVPDAWLGKPVALRMGHFGASKIFIDGKPVAQYGVVANTIENEKVYIPDKPIIIQLDSQFSHAIVVHYSNLHENTTQYPIKFTGFRLLFAPADTASQRGVTEVPTLQISISSLLIFTLFFLFVYFFDVKRLASLLTALMLLNFCCVLTGTYFSRTLQEVASLNWSAFIQIIGSWTTCFQILVLYALYYDGKMPRRTWFIIGLMVLPVFIFLIPGSFSFYFILLINLFQLFEVYRILISGILKKKTGFWILLTGSIIQNIGFFVFVLDVFNLFPIMTKTQEILLMVFPQMGIPLTYALHLAWEFGKANRDLRLQLIQVQDLSKTTQRQQQEKQEILTQQKEKLEAMVTERTMELSQQKEALQNTLNDLKSTQSQLIQSEKMASLGELTAGIAHEIQNPLNFVNNFSEVNKEMLEELKAERLKPKAERDEQLEDEIINDVIGNEEKINHHGKRADAIVKGMLQHSQSSTGVKEPTDINALCDEYLRLSYHGLRAKDKNFNADFKPDFDKTIGKINIIPQDIGRVLLNLYNNAFYATNDRKKTAGEEYKPLVTVQTKKINARPDDTVGRDNLEIKVSDNGNGIPQNIVAKIFQPFFTTKPTGQGTGLGLSLSYDIIKAHGGEIKVNTAKSSGTEFIITLPV